ncbi:MAG: PH domain-containing protein [Candidatus Anstonellaceae archaeon]
MISIKEIPLEKSKVVKGTIATLISVISTIGIGVILFWTVLVAMFKTLFPFLLIVVGALFLIIYFYHYLHYKRYYYNLDKEYLIIKEGVITYSETTIPYYRIQDVYIDQDPLDQLFGLYDLHVATASGQSSLNAHIDGLNYENAQKIKLEILKRLKNKK